MVTAAVAMSVVTAVVTVVAMRVAVVVVATARTGPGQRKKPSMGVVQNDEGLE